MYIAIPITGANAGCMMQFTPREERTLCHALTLYADAIDSDMADDISRYTPNDARKIVRTAQALAQKFDTGRPRTVYTGAQIVIIYDALNMLSDDFGGCDLTDKLIDTLRPYALRHC